MLINIFICVAFANYLKSRRINSKCAGMRVRERTKCWRICISFFPQISFFFSIYRYIFFFCSFCPRFFTKRRRNARDKTQDICTHHSKFQIVSQNSFSLSFHNHYLRSPFVIYLSSFFFYPYSIFSICFPFSLSDTPRAGCTVKNSESSLKRVRNKSGTNLAPLVKHIMRAIHTCRWSEYSLLFYTFEKINTLPVIVNAHGRQYFLDKIIVFASYI